MAKKVIHKIPIVQPIVHRYVRRTPLQALRTVISKDGLGVYASSDTLFRGAIFGRDSLEVAEDLIKIRPKLVRKILLTLGSLQGEEYKRDNEEEPGKIVHEYRRSKVDGRPIQDVSKRIFEELSSRWGGNESTLAYYGSVDSTPHFVRLTCNYCSLYGERILASEVTLRSGQNLSMLAVVENALEWIINQLQNSKSGMIEYKRQNPHGIENQVWKDSKEFYVHENGKLANHDAPISSIEVQALTYDALMLAAELFPDREEEYTEIARNLRKRTIGLLWLEQRQYFAVGTDYDRRGRLRVIKTETANPAEMLESTFFDDLSLDERKKYIGGITRSIMGTHFLTDAGIRSRGLADASLIPFWDYHGSYTTWPKETYDIAKGLRRQGFGKLAVELENRLLNVVQALKSYPEFIYVDARGRVLGAAATAHHHAELVLVDSTNRPEKIQAWTVSAVVSILASRKFKRLLSITKINKRQKLPLNWQNELEKEIFSHIPIVKLMKSYRELSARYPAYPYELKTK